MTGKTRPSARTALRVALAASASVWVLAVAGLFGYESWSLRAGRDGVTVGTGPADPFLKFAVPGIARPSTVEAGASSLRADEEVIGLEVGGRARAYRLDALRDRSKHLVNDLIGGVPASVAYCDLGDCARAYVGPEGGGPLDVSVAGLYEGRRLVLDVGGVLYFQDSGAPIGPGPGLSTIPLGRISTTRMTWGEWKRLHPSTDVYEGVR